MAKKPREILNDFISGIGAVVTVAFGAGPSMAYSVTLVKDSIEEFKNDFNK